MTEPATTPPPAAAPERDALLATKLHVPRPRAGFLARSRLLERLTQGTARKLTLVCAPAGFGKTSVLGEWAGRRLLRPFLRGYARRQIERLQLQPVKAEAEALARQRRRR